MNNNLLNHMKGIVLANRKSTSNTLFFIILIILALGFSIASGWQCNMTTMGPDAGLYMYISTHLMANPLHLTDENGALFYLNPPLFLYILALVFSITGGSSIVVAHIVVLCFGAGTVICTGILAKRLCNPATALFAALLLASNPLFFFFENRMLIDIPLAFFITLAILFLTEKRIAAFYATAVASVMMKYPAALLLLVPALQQAAKKNRWYALMLIAVSTIPLLILLYLQSINALPLGWWDYFLGFFHTPDWHQLLMERHYLNPWIFLLSLIGFIHFVRKKPTSPLVIWFTLFFAVRLFLPWINHRYSLPLYPAIMIFSAHGLYTIIAFLRHYLPHHPSLANAMQLTVMLFLLSSNLSNPIVSGTRINKFTGYQYPAVFIAKRHLTTILSPSPRQFKYYLPNSTVIDLPRDSDPFTVEQQIQTRHIEAIILDRWSPHMPSWAPSYFINNHAYDFAYSNKSFAIFIAKPNPIHPVNNHHNIK